MNTHPAVTATGHGLDDLHRRLSAAQTPRKDALAPARRDDRQSPDTVRRRS